ncbi:MAG: hypothetical protein R3F61_08615 [Myxococcota bacterium]
MSTESWTREARGILIDALLEHPLTWSERLRPRPDDFEAVFGPHAKAVSEGYGVLWENPVLPGPKVDQTQLLVTVQSARELATDPKAARRFPGGFAAVVPVLPADSVWATWKFTRPGELSGMAYDGLCRRSADRWVWFPKLWRVLELD